MRELIAGSDHVLKIVANPKKKFYVLAYYGSYKEYYVIIHHISEYCLKRLNNKSDVIHPEFPENLVGSSYHSSKSIQEVLNELVRYITDRNEYYYLYEFESKQEFLESII